MTETETNDMLAEGTIDIPDAERLTGLGRTYFYKLMGEGKLRSVKIGKRRLILRASLMALLRRGLVETEGE